MKYAHIILVITSITSSNFAYAMPSALSDFSGIVDKNAAAIVNIRAIHDMDTKNLNIDPFLENYPGSLQDKFSKRFLDDESRDRMRPQLGLGSGFIISKDGYVITNAHVVEGSDKIVVQLNDYRELDARLVGEDKRTDIAVLKLDVYDLPIVKIGDSDQIRVGQWVLAIGAPFGLQHTATQGIVSAIGRALPNDVYIPFIQTDAAVNPGNSGGPLFDMQGEVIGVNTQIYSNTGGYMGLSFSVPINEVMQVAQQIESKGYASHGYMGVQIQPVTAELAKAFGLDRPKGALIAQVELGGPAAKAGLRNGDIIVRFGRKNINDATELPALVSTASIGDEINVEIIRNGKPRRTQVVIAPLSTTGSDEIGLAKKAIYQLGLEVDELTSAQRAAAHVDDHSAVIVDIEPNSVAARSGLRAGDIILNLAGQDIENVADLIKRVESLPHQAVVSVLVQRNGMPLYLALNIPKA